MLKENGIIKYIPLFENEKNTRYSSCAIPFKDVKEIMEKQRYLRINIFKNKFWNSTDKSHLPKFTATLMSTTTEKEIEIEEDESHDQEHLIFVINELRDAIKSYVYDGETSQLESILCEYPYEF